MQIGQCSKVWQVFNCHGPSFPFQILWTLWNSLSDILLIFCAGLTAMEWSAATLSETSETVWVDGPSLGWVFHDDLDIYNIYVDIATWTWKLVSVEIPRWDWSTLNWAMMIRFGKRTAPSLEDYFLGNSQVAFQHVPDKLIFSTCPW